MTQKKKTITTFNNQAISSSIEITMAVAPALVSSDLKEDSFDGTSTPAYLMSCTLTGFMGGFGLDPFQISSTRLISDK